LDTPQSSAPFEMVSGICLADTGTADCLLSVRSGKSITSNGKQSSKYVVEPRILKKTGIVWNEIRSLSAVDVGFYHQ
jgi:hypothetical protein